MELEWEQILFQLILHAGSARSFAKEAAELAESGKWEDADVALQQANEEQTRRTRSTQTSSPSGQRKH